MGQVIQFPKKQVPEEEIEVSLKVPVSLQIINEVMRLMNHWAGLPWYRRIYWKWSKVEMKTIINDFSISGDCKIIMMDVNNLHDLVHKFNEYKHANLIQRLFYWDKKISTLEEVCDTP